jgi:hypothetical protein
LAQQCHWKCIRGYEGKHLGVEKVEQLKIFEEKLRDNKSRETVPFRKQQILQQQYSAILFTDNKIFTTRGAAGPY